MTASRRVVRTARAVAAVFIGSTLLQGVAQRGAEASTVECTAATVEQVEFQATATAVTFKCGVGFPEFLPGDLTTTYETNAFPNNSGVAAAQPVALKSALHKAVLTKDATGADPTYTLTVSQSTVVQADKSLYYYCKKADANEYCTLRVDVKARAAKPATTCSSKTLNKILLDKDDTSIKFACDNAYSTFLPDGLTEVYTTRGDRKAALTTLYPQATLEQDSSSTNEYTLTIPERTNTKILYFRCQKAEDDVCDVEVTVEKNKQGSDFGTPVTCTSTTDQVDVTLAAEYPGVAFACGVDVPTLDPEDLTKVYDKEEMQSAVELSTLFKKAALYTDSTVAAHTYLLYIPHREEKKSLYYQCKSDSKTCKVKVTIEANKDVVPVCQNAATGTYLSYEDFNENVKFKCDAAYPDVVPSDLTMVYDKDPSANSSAKAVALTSVYSGAKLESDGDKKSPTFKLTIPEHLPREVKKIYYQCKKADNTYCTVSIRVAEKKPQMMTCSAGGEEKVTITGAGEIVRFKCGDNLTLHPTSAEEVYDNDDKKCSTSASLTTLVPKASLATDKEDENGKVLTFTELPTTDKSLCYSCSDPAQPQAAGASFRAPQTSKHCKVLVEVKSAAHSLNAQTLAGHALILMSLAGAVFSAL